MKVVQNETKSEKELHNGIEKKSDSQCNPRKNEFIIQRQIQSYHESKSGKRSSASSACRLRNPDYLGIHIFIFFKIRSWLYP